MIQGTLLSEAKIPTILGRILITEALYGLVQVVFMLSEAGTDRIQ